MSVVKINAIEIPEGAGPELESRFAARLGAVDGAPGFEEFCLLRPTAGESRYFVYTRWATEEAYQAWSATRAQGLIRVSRPVDRGRRWPPGRSCSSSRWSLARPRERSAYHSPVTDYFIRLVFNDDTDEQIVQLPGLTRDEAEQFTAELRHEVEQAREIDAPVVQMSSDHGPDLALEPSRIVSIDIDEAE